MAFVQFSVGGGNVQRTLNDWTSFSDVTPAGATTLTSVVMPNPADPSWVVVGGSGSFIRYSTDQGGSWNTPTGDWSTLPAFTLTELKSVAGSSFVYGFTNQGLIVSTDYGASFNIVTTPFSSAVSKVVNGHFFSTTDGVIIGNLVKDPPDPPTIYITADGGSSWTGVTHPASATDFSLGDVYASSANHIVIFSANDQKIYTTFNGGTSWVEFSTDYPDNVDYFSMKFFDANNGFVGGGDEIWLVTTDAGATWTTVSSDSASLDKYYGMYIESLGSIYRSFLDSASGDTEIQKSTDGGLTFSLVNTFAAALGGSNDIDGAQAVVNGCTDPRAYNYDPAATTDDGSCILPYIITNCQDKNETYVTDTDLSLVVGQAVKFLEFPDKCFDVAEHDSPDTPTTVTLDEQYLDCDDCVATLPLPENFQVDQDQAINDGCSQLTITDTGNYTTVTESGHAQSDFSDYRKIILTRPDSTTYTYSSLGDGDDTVSPASSGNHDVFYDFLETDEDGVYIITVCSVPTYNALATYDQDTDFVYFNNVLYQSLVDSNTGNQPDTSPTEWAVVTEDDLSTKYCSEEIIGVTCIQLLGCYERATHNANCVINDEFCNDDVICKNSEVLKAIKLRILLDEIAFMIDKNRRAEAVNSFNLAKTLCNC